MGETSRAISRDGQSSVPECREEARWDLEELKSSYRAVKKEKSLPQLERLLQNSGQCFSHASRDPVTCGAWGSGTREKELSQCPPCLCWKDLLCRVRSSGAAPLAWRHSSGAPLHKSNKAGPKGKRVVHVLPSMGKAILQSPAVDEKGRVDARPHPLTGCMATFRGGGVNWQSLSDKPRHGGWNDLD